MKIKAWVLLFNCLFLFNLGCNNKDNNEFSYDAYESYLDDDYSDGKYCAEVEYYNPSTGTRSTYYLNVEVEDGELTIIYWPNGGWLDNSHFTPEDITSGECEFTSDKGYRYTITLIDLGKCNYTDEYKIRRDVNNDIKTITCPKCGDEKEKYDDYCYSCEREIEDIEENTCYRCGLYEYSIYSGLCSNCKKERDEY